MARDKSLPPTPRGSTYTTGSDRRRFSTLPIRRVRPGTLTVPAPLAPLQPIITTPIPEPPRRTPEPVIISPPTSIVDHSVIFPPFQPPMLPLERVEKQSKPPLPAYSPWPAWGNRDPNDKSDNRMKPSRKKTRGGLGGLNALMPRSLNTGGATSAGAGSVASPVDSNEASGPNRFVGGWKFWATRGHTAPRSQSQSSSQTTIKPRPRTIRQMRDLTGRNQPTITITPNTPDSSNHGRDTNTQTFSEENGGTKESFAQPIPLPTPVPTMQGLRPRTPESVYPSSPVPTTPGPSMSRATSRATSRTRSRYRSRTPKPQRNKWAHANSVASWATPPAFLFSNKSLYDDGQTEPSVYGDKSTVYGGNKSNYGDDKSTVYGGEKSTYGGKSIKSRRSRRRTRRTGTEDASWYAAETNGSAHTFHGTTRNTNILGDTPVHSLGGEAADLTFTSLDPSRPATTLPPTSSHQSYQSRPSQYPKRPIAPGPASTLYTDDQRSPTESSGSGLTEETSSSDRTYISSRFKRLWRFFNDLINLPWRGDDDLYGPATGITATYKFRGNGKRMGGVSPRPRRDSSMPRLCWYTPKRLSMLVTGRTAGQFSTATTTKMSSGDGGTPYHSSRSGSEKKKKKKNSQSSSHKGPSSAVSPIGSPFTGTNPFQVLPALSGTKVPPYGGAPSPAASASPSYYTHPNQHALLSSYHQSPMPGGMGGSVKGSPPNGRPMYPMSFNPAEMQGYHVAPNIPNFPHPPGPGIILVQPNGEPVWVPTDPNGSSPPALYLMPQPHPSTSGTLVRSPSDEDPHGRSRSDSGGTMSTMRGGQSTLGLPNYPPGVPIGAAV